MTAKLLFQLDTDAHPSVFDTVVAYDGGADHVIGHSNVTPDAAGALVEGAIFTRGAKDKRYTALFVGGASMTAGEALLEAVRAKFYGGFRVSVMLDSNGANTTAAAGVALLAKTAPLSGQRAIVLGATGPVGMRVAAMLALEGAEVAITGRKLGKTQAAADSISKRFNVSIRAVEAPDDAARARAAEGCAIIYAAGAIGHQLIAQADWQGMASAQLLADVNPEPPFGIGGIGAGDKARDYDGKLAFGALGIGGLKLRLHRACIGKLFDQNDLVLDAENILAIAKEMA
jgi:hypothetical protein